jgi:uncharacterized protein (TIGR03066 family)
LTGQAGGNRRTLRDSAGCLYQLPAGTPLAAFWRHGFSVTRVFHSKKGVPMKSLATAVACCLVLALAGPCLAAEKTNKDKLVGVWEVTKSENAPAGATVEFTKDGKMIVTIKDGDKTVKVEGTYTLDKDSITSVLKIKDKDNKETETKETVTITKLTDKELAVKDSKGKVDEFKKK